MSLPRIPPEPGQKPEPVPPLPDKPDDEPVKDPPPAPHTREPMRL